MTYQVLARKWRPQTFKDVAGQSHVVPAIINALENNRLHHAYLLTGTRGVGKTSIARLFAKALSCEKGISANPCEKCKICTAINNGSFMDLIEVDAASRTKVEDTRELLENVQYAPTQGRFKIYLIDEVHMLSGHSFNALLKTLEEPPEHVKFLLATTDPQKLPVTVLSRCLQFHLKHLTTKQLTEHLEKISKIEKLDYELNALEQIAKAASGSVRDSLSLLDQAIAYGNGSVTQKIIADMLGTTDNQVLFDILQHTHTNSPEKLIQTMADIAEANPHYSQILEDLLALLHTIMISQQAPGSAKLHTNANMVTDLANQLSKQDIQLYYQIILKGYKDLQVAPNKQQSFEVSLIRLLAFKPAAHTENNQAPNQGSSSSNIQNTPNTPPLSNNKSSRPLADFKKNQLLKQKPTKDTSNPTGSNHKIEANNTSSTQQNQMNPAAKPDSNAKEHPENIDVNQNVTDTPENISSSDWPNIVNHLKLTGMSGALVSHCTIQKMNNCGIILVLEAKHKAMLSDKTKDRLKAALDQYFGKTMQLQIIVGESEEESPAQQKERVHQSRVQIATTAIDNDPVVQKLQQTFDAAVDMDSLTLKES